jgi:hypothetical protein
MRKDEAMETIINVLVEGMAADLTARRQAVADKDRQARFCYSIGLKVANYRMESPQWWEGN